MITRALVLAVAAAGITTLASPTPVTWSDEGAEDSRVQFVAADGSPVWVGPMAGRPAVGDCNGDGSLDIVVACGTCCGDKADPRAGHLVVLLGDGRGGFKPAVGSPIKIGSSVRKVALGDVNRDGKLDAVAAEHDSYFVTVLLGDGRGGFRAAPGSPFKTSNGSRAHTHDVVLGDVNGDGHPDILTTNVNDNSVSVLLGDGKGVFMQAPASPVQVGRGPYDSLVLRDLDGDGKPDLVTPNIGGNILDVLRGDGKGGFTRIPGAPFPGAERPGYVAAADINKDGKPDLLATHDDVGLLTVLLDDGEGSYRHAAGSPLRLSAAAWGFDVADLDGDANLDLAMGVMGNASPLVLLGDGKGGFKEQERVKLVAGQRPEYVVLADLNRDGRLDLAVGNYGSGDVSIFLAQKRDK